MALKKSYLPLISLILFLSSIICFYFYATSKPLNPESPKFIGKVIQMYFIYIIEFFAIFMTVRNINPKQNVYIEIIISSIFISIFAPELMDTWTHTLNKIIISFTPVRLTDIILGSDRAQQLWPFAVILINVGIMYIRHSISVKMKLEKPIGLKKILIDGFALYGVLVLLLWIQAHFSYVDAFFSYMTSETRFVHEIIKENEQNPEYLKKFNILYVDKKEDMNAEILLRYKESGDKVKQNINAKFLSETDLYLGNPNNKSDQLNWDNMKGFEDWVSFINNSNNKIITPDHIVITKLVFPDKSTPKLEMVRQGILYVKKSSNKPGYYYYFTLSDTFQSNKKHYLFTGSFILFNIIMVFAIAYLYQHHKKKVFNKGL